MNKELISVIVPCYNQAQYLDECLQSVFDQTYQNWECIIVNDGSSDHTEEVALHWVEKDTRFSYVKKENGGAGSARNFGIEKSKGDWIQFLDGDDILLPKKLELILDIDSEINFIYCDFKTLINGQYLKGFSDLNKYSLNIENLISLWDSGLNVPIHSPIFKKDLIDNVRFIEEFKLHEDWLFWIMIFNNKNVYLKFYNFSYVIYRNHSLSTTKDQDKLEKNTNKVYKYAYNNILSLENKSMLFDSIVEKFTSSRRKFNYVDNELYKLRNGRYYKFRRFLYQLFKISKNN